MMFKSLRSNSKDNAVSVNLNQFSAKIGGVAKKLGAQEAEEQAALIEQGNDPRRLVRIGFNLLAIDDLNDKSNTFHCNFLIHIKWENKGDNWHPWMQWKNASDLAELENPGAARLNEESKKGTIVESYNMVGTFAKTLDVRHFPFDMQELTFIMVCNSTKDCVLSYMSPAAIKANFEYEVLSEWTVVRDEKGAALSYFSFESADPKLSAQGAGYNNFIFNVIVKRNAWAVILSTVIPSTLLSISCLCAYSLDILEGPGDRFSVVFTIILTLVANQIVTKERLPIIPYYTFIDWYLLMMQLTCFFIGAEAAFVTMTVRPLTTLAEKAEVANYYDFWGFIVSVLLNVAISLYFIVRGTLLRRWRNQEEAIAKEKAITCRQSYGK